MRHLLSALFLVSAIGRATPPLIEQHAIAISCFYRLSVKTAIYPSLLEKTRGDVIFLHGFGDQSLNHSVYFHGLQKNGFRVIAFDFPDHGETTGASLNRTTFRKLTQIAIEIEKRTREDSERPLILSGWSTGGLVAYRSEQAWTFPAFGREVRGLILWTPGNHVKMLVGKYGVVTEETLTSHPSPPYVSKPQPWSPFLRPIFAGNLLMNSILSRWQGKPRLPILALLAGEKDRYVDSAALLAFYNNHDPNLTLVREYPESLHGIDAEVETISLDAIHEAALFAQAIVNGEIEEHIRHRRAKP